MSKYRCSKCKIAGSPDEVAKHELTCIAKPCASCEGRGFHIISGCIFPSYPKCEVCNGWGVDGGVLAVNAAHKYAINLVRMN